VLRKEQKREEDEKARKLAAAQEGRQIEMTRLRGEGGGEGSALPGRGEKENTRGGVPESAFRNGEKRSEGTGPSSLSGKGGGRSFHNPPTTTMYRKKNSRSLAFLLSLVQEGEKKGFQGFRCE